MTNSFSDLLKRPQVWGSILAVVIIAIVSFVYFYPDASQGNLLRQFDMQQGAAIGHEAQQWTEATGHSPRWTNSLFSGMPTFQISPSYGSSKLFSWINTVMGLGLPSPANLLVMMMVGFLILGLSLRMKWPVALIGAIAYGFSSYFIIIIGAGHIWKFITLAYIPPTFAGIVLAYRGRYLLGGALAALFAMMQIAGNHVQMSYYFIFVVIGFVIAAFVKALRAGNLKRFSIATCVLAVAAALAVGANLPSLYNTYEYSKQTMRGNHSDLTPEGESAQAGDKNGGLDRDYITQYSYGRAETFSLLIPNIKGGASIKPEKGSHRQLTLADLPEAQKMVNEGKIDRATAQYLQWTSQYFGEPEGTNGPVYVGALIVALFLVGCFVVKGPLKWVLLILTIFSILLALGRNCMWFTDLMIDYMPMYNRFRTVESILVIAEFTMPLLAMLALGKLLDGKPSEKWAKVKTPLMIGFGVVIVICLLGVVSPGVFGNPVTENDYASDEYISNALANQGADQATIHALSLENPAVYVAVRDLRESMVTADSLRSLIITAIGLALLLLYYRRKLSATLAVVGCGVLVCGDLYMVNKRYLDHDSFISPVIAGADPFPLTDTDRKILADTTTHYRVFNLPQFYQPGPSYHHKAIGGYHAAKLTRYQDLIDRHLSHFTSNDVDNADWNVANMLNARYIVDFAGEAHLNPEAYGNAWFVDRIVYADGADAEMAALDTISPLFTAVADKSMESILGKAELRPDSLDYIRLTTYAPDRLTYTTSSANGGVAVFSEVYFPWGWNATVDGKPVDIARVDYLLRAIKLPAGRHTVEMVFDPESLHTTEGIAYASVSIIYLLLIIGITAGVITALNLPAGKKSKK